MTEQPSFWLWLSTKHGITEQYEAFMEVKRRANKRACFQCKTGTCCWYEGGRNPWFVGTPIMDVADTIQRRQHEYIYERRDGSSYPSNKEVCTMLTEGAMCAVEEVKSLKCMHHYCSQMALSPEERATWHSFFDTVYKVWDTNRDRRQTVGEHVWHREMVQEWFALHPHYVDVVKGRLNL